MTWSDFKILKRDDFKYPDKLDISVVFGLDELSKRLGVHPIILSDYRPGDTKQHGQGTAIDFYMPDYDPIRILNEIKAMRYFHGYGMYLNEKNVVSFHVDMRSDRSADNPATWGAYINPDSDGNREYNYVALANVLESVKAIFGGNSTTTIIICLLAIGFILSYMRS
jgi:hypothetical protein